MQCSMTVHAYLESLSSRDLIQISFIKMGKYSCYTMSFLRGVRPPQICQELSVENELNALEIKMPSTNQQTQILFNCWSV